MPRRPRKRLRLGQRENRTGRLAAQRVNQVWSSVFDQTADGPRLKWLPICDEFSRELVALKVQRRMEARDASYLVRKAFEWFLESPMTGASKAHQLSMISVF